MTQEAVRDALRYLPVVPPFTRHGALPAFSKVLAGYAGCARPADYELLLPALQRLLSDTPSPEVTLTSDAGLLAFPLYTSDCESAVTLICGTGSLGLLWQKENGSLKQIGRSGGWGSVLGDEGSGWSLGREGIKSVLDHTANGTPFVDWHRYILSYFDIEDPNLLLGAATSLSSSWTEADRKKRIAGCARFVIDAAAAGDTEAERLVSAVAGELVELLRTLVQRQGGDVSRTMLVITGGVGHAPAFWEKVEIMMDRLEWRWGDTLKISDPAEQGVKTLLDGL